ncbi:MULTISPECIES: hypothetical protein [Mycobacterium avium complex (MAC)]|jgi:hypothetical protein|uniref:hypothetical protein n=1 Tax=Mycobacterium avium TaxID=1764 RepID=UPI0003D1E7A4|nr:hypothetical protein [Mycobacterium avium]ETA90028.1 hypothetical protein O984_24315 [Mycobacterium avium 05-4293]ETB17835.1 hypothetical protein O983_26185 [Mycobacterium avium 09-5983]ETB31060.1 hypothetical protein N602_31690 [Mycobacterium avium subsp. hominissuis 10-5606]MBZ4522161.1 hypothetical protein [Mycobacterium avium subsp. hominissuis]MBZ4526658.1 hypothetical protein [Mycobacterium avium subsp. hominissuis]
MSSVVAEHPVIASVDDNGTERITVFDHDTTVICGAFKPAGHLYWRLYMSAATASFDSPAPQAVPPAPLLAARRQDACRWLEFIARCYVNPGSTAA